MKSTKNRLELKPRFPKSNTNTRAFVFMFGQKGFRLRQDDLSRISESHVRYLLPFSNIFLQLRTANVYTPETLDGNPGTREPVHHSPGSWSQGIFLFFIFYFLFFGRSSCVFHNVFYRIFYSHIVLHQILLDSVTPGICSLVGNDSAITRNRHMMYTRS